MPVGTLTNSGTQIALELDGCFVSFDRALRHFVVTAKTGAVITVHQIPVRPMLGAAGASSATPTAPINKAGMAVKLGHKKVPVTGAARWQPRYFSLNGSTLIYRVDGPEGAVRGELELRPGCTAKVIQAEERARKDRYEDQDASVFRMMTQPMGEHMSLTSTPIGKSNCVELHMPAQVGNMLGSVMNASPMGMVAGGGIKDMKKNQARTYYWACDSLEEANEWVVALENNIKLAKAPAPAAGAIHGMSMAQIDGAMNMAHQMQADQKNMTNPAESLGWYQRNLKTDLSAADLHKHLMVFYDALKAAGVAC